MQNVKREGWSPYLAGALAGLLAVLSVLASTRILESTQYFGTSTTFVRVAGFLQNLVAPESVAANTYYQANRPRLDWQMLFVVGILLGALAASASDRSFRLESAPPIWTDRFGSRAGLRAVAAFFAGAIAMFGARLADGCPSGHGMSGLMQLSTSGFLAMMGFFGGGVLVAHLIYKKAVS